jgi:hypothetical protein
MKEQWESPRVLGRARVCRIAISEMPTVGFVIFSNAYRIL